MKPYIHPSEHPSNTDMKQLQELVHEMSKTLNLLDSSEPVIADPSSDAEELHNQILSMVMPITEQTENMYLKSVVGSIFDTYSVEDTILELKDINEWFREKHPEAAPPERPSDQTI